MDGMMTDEYSHNNNFLGLPIHEGTNYVMWFSWWFCYQLVARTPNKKTCCCPQSKR
jgi:hypothetical protein